MFKKIFNPFGIGKKKQKAVQVISSDKNVISQNASYIAIPTDNKKASGANKNENISSKESQQNISEEEIKAKITDLEQIRKNHSLPPNLSDEIIQLAAINSAFLEGILALKKMDLDNDIFQDAVNDLRKKYDKVRAPHVVKQLQNIEQEKAASKNKLL